MLIFILKSLIRADLPHCYLLQLKTIIKIILSNFTHASLFCLDYLELNHPLLESESILLLLLLKTNLLIWKKKKAFFFFGEILLFQIFFAIIDGFLILVFYGFF